MRLLLDIRNLTRRKQLIIISSMLVNIGLGVVQLILSSVRLSLFLGFSGTFYIVLALGKFFALQRLLNSKIVDETLIKNAEVRSIDRINYCTLICSLLFLCFGIVITFFYEDPANYDLGMIIFISTLAVIKFFALIISAIVTLRKKSGVKYYIKLMSLAAMLISLALVQRAILYYIEVDYPSFFSGIGGIFFGLLATLVGLFMVKKARGQKRELINQNLLDSSYLKNIDVNLFFSTLAKKVSRILDSCWRSMKRISIKIVEFFKKVFKV